MVTIRQELLQSSTTFLASFSEGLFDYLLNMFGNILKAFLDAAIGGVQPERIVSNLVSRSDLAEEFSGDRCRKWFDSLCMEKEGVMNPNDILTLCEAINKNPSDIVFLFLAYKMGAKNCGYFHQKEWVKGMTELGIDSSQKLQANWNRFRLLFDDPDVEKNVYKFSYDFSRDRDRDGNNIDVLAASELIKLFLERKWIHCQAFLQFLTFAGVKVLTRDQFMNILDFSRCVKTLEDYDDTAAWPVLMDEFVSHVALQKDLYGKILQEEGKGLPQAGEKRTFSSDFDSVEINSKRKF